MKKRKQQQRAISDLPEDIIMIEILTRLPFDSIKAFKCVSKRWKSIIDDYFRRYGHKTVTFSHDNILYSLSITKDRCRRSPPLRLRRVPIDHTSWVLALNGMVCSSQYNGEILFHNLLTGTSYNVTGPPLQEWLTSSRQCFGLGYDAHDCDYKMVIVCKYYRFYGIENFDINTVQNKDNGLFWVYCFKSLGWERLEGFPYAKYEWGPWWYLNMPCSLNGVIHWSVNSKELPVRNQRKPTC